MSIPLKKIRVVQNRPCRFLPEKPFNIKPRFTEYRRLSEDLIKAIDEQLSFNPKMDPKELENNDLLTKWVRIRSNPEEHRIYCFYFKRRFKHPAVRGKWVYAYTFWDLFDMVESVGRRFEIHGYFEDKPLSYYGPPSKEDWVTIMLQDEYDRGKPVTDRTVAFYRKAYKRRDMVDKQKLINLLWIPTWTRSGVSSIHAKTKDTQELTMILADTTSKMSEVIAKHEVLKAEVEAQRKIEKAQIEEGHRSRDTIHRLTLQLEAEKRKGRERAIPILHPPAHPYRPEARPPPPSGVSQLLKGIPRWSLTDFLMGLLIIAGVLSLLYGSMLYGKDPSQWGILALGVGALAIVLITHLWRQRTMIPVETLKEKGEEIREEATAP